MSFFWGADESTLDFAITYLKVFALASPFVLFSQSMGNIVRADRDATGAMLASMSGSLLNILLDALFILVLLILNMTFGAYGIAFSHAITMSSHCS